MAEPAGTLLVPAEVDGYAGEPGPFGVPAELGLLPRPDECLLGHVLGQVGILQKQRAQPDHMRTVIRHQPQHLLFGHSHLTTSLHPIYGILCHSVALFGIFLIFYSVRGCKIPLARSSNI